MEEIKVNETPVRTSKNFNINNIKLKNIRIPKETSKFRNLTITGQNSQVQIEETKNDVKLTYGLGEVLISQLEKYSNKNLEIISNCKKNEELELAFKIDEENKNLMENINIIANEKTKTNIIIKYSSEEKVEGFHNGILKVIAKEDSEINITIINFINEVSNHFISLESNIKENAKVNYTIIDFGGKNSITNYYSNLEGNFADNQIRTIYIGKNEQTFDMNYIGELRGQRSNIDIEVQGALKSSSKKHFKGTIDFKKGCKKAKGNENESCMLLSDTAKSLALPMLLCSEEDIEGNHSSSAGKIGEKELFYIMSRGFNQTEAMKLIVRAKFNKILETIQNKNLKSEIIKEIDNRLNEN